MRSFYGEHKKKSYFEGWYLKHQAGGHTIGFIPAYHIDESGQRGASIQVITQDKAYYIPYPKDEFQAASQRFYVKIGENIFSEQGMHISIQTDAVCISGDLEYGPFTPLKKDIMGPFRFVPGMQCSHGVLSMDHTVNGTLTINGERIDFQDGTGYIETDRGSSFPKTYLWTQCNNFQEKGVSVMASAADVPIGPLSFMGCICSVLYQGQEYRLATYHGVEIPRINQRELELKQGDYTLKVTMIDGQPQALSSPCNGSMHGTVHECAACTARYKFYQGDKVLFDLTSGQASFEYVEQ